MKVEIEVSEEKFKQIIEKEIDAFSKEELHEIIRNCIVNALQKFPLKKLFVNEGYCREEPTQVLIEAAKSIDLSPAYEDIQNKIITMLKDNYQELLEKVMLSVIINGLTNNNNFRETINKTVTDIIRR